MSKPLELLIATYVLMCIQDTSKWAPLDSLTKGRRWFLNALDLIALICWIGIAWQTFVAS